MMSQTSRSVVRCRPVLASGLVHLAGPIQDPPVGVLVVSGVVFRPQDGEDMVKTEVFLVSKEETKHFTKLLSDKTEESTTWDTQKSRQWTTPLFSVGPLGTTECPCSLNVMVSM